MNHYYVRLEIAHQSLSAPKNVVVVVTTQCGCLNDYIELAKEKICEKFDFNKDELIIFEQEFLGGNFELII